MPDLETRLALLPREADATVFAHVVVTPALRARVARAVQASAAPGAARSAPARAPLLARPTRWQAARQLAVAASVAAAATVVAVGLWPGGTGAASAALTVKPAGVASLVSVADPHALAATRGVIALRGDGTKRILVEIDSASSLTYRWSPDGRSLVFGNSGDLFVHDIETGRTINVTNTPRRWELLPSWAPNGEMLAFTSRDLLPGEGPEPSAGSSADWTMVGVHGGRPAVVRTDGSEYRVLDEATVTEAPSWSPDGTTLAYAIDGIVEADVPGSVSGRRDGTIHLADVAGGGIRMLEPILGRGPGYVGAASWSPVTNEIAFFFSESDRFPSRDEAMAGTAPVVRQGWAVLDVGSGAVSRVHEYDAPFVPRGQALWSDDGSLLALLLRQQTSISQPPSALVVVARDGSSAASIPGLLSHVAWEPGTHRLVARDDVQSPSVLLAAVDGGALRVERLRFDAEIDGLAWRAETGS